MEKTILSFDVGQKKIGVALGNTLTGVANPLTIIFSEVKKQRWAAIEKLVKEWGPDYVVVGLALTADGQEQDSSLRARRFARQFEGRFQRPCVFQDETNTSLQAQAALRGSNEADDALAACIILQRHLDAL